MLIDDLAQDGGHNFDFGKLLANNQLTATFKLARWAKEEALLSCKIYNTHAKDITTFDNSTLFYQSPETAFVLLLKQGRRTFVFQHATFYKELFRSFFNFCNTKFCVILNLFGDILCACNCFIIIIIILNVCLYFYHHLYCKLCNHNIINNNYKKINSTNKELCEK